MFGIGEIVFFAACFFAGSVVGATAAAYAEWLRDFLKGLFGWFSEIARIVGNYLRAAGREVLVVIERIGNRFKLVFAGKKTSQGESLRQDKTLSREEMQRLGYKGDAYCLETLSREQMLVTLR